MLVSQAGGLIEKEKAQQAPALMESVASPQTWVVQKTPSRTKCILPKTKHTTLKKPNQTL